jgi:hypothetical protein
LFEIDIIKIAKDSKVYREIVTTKLMIKFFSNNILQDCSFHTVKKKVGKTIALGLILIKCCAKAPIEGGH